MSLLAMGLSHHSASLDLLEQVTVPPTELPELTRALSESEHLDQVVVLATCNRLEVYAQVAAFHPAVGDIAQTVARRAGIDVTGFANHCYAYYGPDAVRHVLRVAAGLDSMVVGEPQILGQLRAAYATARSTNTVKTELHELLQHALRVGKRVRSQTELDHAGQSMVTAALQFAEPHLGELSQRRAIIIGAGSMATLAATTLRRAHIGALTILNRTPQRAARLAAKVDGLAGGLDELETEIARTDLIITATGSGVLLDKATLRSAGKPGPLVICDLAVPRDVADDVTELDGVRLINVATLGATHQDQGVAPAAIDAAERIVAAELAEFAAVLRQHTVTPAVTALRSRAEAVVTAELGALYNRLPHLPAEHAAELERTVRRVVATLLHEPTVKVKELSQRAGDARYVDALAELFSLNITGAPVSAALKATRETVPDADSLAARLPPQPQDQKEKPYESP